MTSTDIERLIEKADGVVMDLCGPDKMTKPDAVEFLDGLINNLQGAIDALNEEMGEE